MPKHVLSSVDEDVKVEPLQIFPKMWKRHETKVLDDDLDPEVAETQFLKMEKDLAKTHRTLVESQEQQSALQLGLVSTGLGPKVYGLVNITLFQQENTSTFMVEFLFL